jgi:conjugative transposon TraM protein
MRNPKYGLPLVLLPFLILFAYVLSTFVQPKEESAVELQKKDGINMELPDPTLATQKDKFTLLLEMLGKKGEGSDIKDISEEFEREEIPLSIEQPVTDSFLLGEGLYEDETEMALRAMQEKYFPMEIQEEQERQPQSAQAEELALIRAQLFRLDSMMQAEQHNKTTTEVETVPIPVEEILVASKVDEKVNNHFNTISANKRKSFITAILDEAETVVDGSRIRIRLLDDIFIGDNLFEKGAYLYGLVSGFSAQRVHVDINSVLYGNAILKTKLTIYDNDGIKGLYVPNSDFREMMQNAGGQMVSGSNVMINSGQNPYEQLLTQMGQDFYRSVTRAVGQKIRQNKAKLKYSTVIYLINTEVNR